MRQGERGVNVWRPRAFPTYKMTKQRYVCRKNKAGNPIMVRFDKRMEYHKDETVDSFEKRIRGTLHQLECRDGSRFHIPDTSTAQLKEAWGG